ncbi:MAG: hypothetical protein K6G88_09475 [Lachnospiraceae bacterium]|nr:hypothetical protein [Lachnospiraceae bacterium]
MRLSKVAICTLVVSIFMTSGVVFARNGEKVSVSIDKNQTSAKSTNSIWNCQGNLELVGVNKKSSKRKLYVTCMEQKDYAADRKEEELKLNIDQSQDYTWALSAEENGEKFYVKLNPEGPLAKGCVGNGTLYD